MKEHMKFRDDDFSNQFLKLVFKSDPYWYSHVGKSFCKILWPHLSFSQKVLFLRIYLKKLDSSQGLYKNVAALLLRVKNQEQYIQ